MDFSCEDSKSIPRLPLENLNSKQAQLKAIQPRAPVILICSSPYSEDSQLADHQLDSFQPVQLLELLQRLQPEKIKAIQKNNERLANEELGVGSRQFKREHPTDKS